MKHSSNAQISYAPGQVLMFRANLLLINLNIITFLDCILLLPPFHECFSNAGRLCLCMAKKYLVRMFSDSNDAVLVPNCLCPIPKTVGGAIWIFYILYTNGLARLLVEIFQSCIKLWNVVIYFTYLHCNHELRLTHCIYICCHDYKMKGLHLILKRFILMECKVQLHCLNGVAHKQL